MDEKAILENKISDERIPQVKEDSLNDDYN